MQNQSVSDGRSIVHGLGQLRYQDLEFTDWRGVTGNLVKRRRSLATAVRYHLPSFRAIAADKATTMGHIQRQHLHEAKVLIPPPSEFEKLNSYFGPLFDKIVANRIETRKLVELRDTTLPKLLPGKVRVA